jgi:hypothetical protein
MQPHMEVQMEGFDIFGEVTGEVQMEGFDIFGEVTGEEMPPSFDQAARHRMEKTYGPAQTLPASEVILPRKSGVDVTQFYSSERVGYWPKTEARPHHAVLVEVGALSALLAKCARARFKPRACKSEELILREVALLSLEAFTTRRPAAIPKGQKLDTRVAVAAKDSNGKPVLLIAYYDDMGFVTKLYTGGQE